VRMWLQAATTMATYQAVSGSAVVSMRQTSAAPQIATTGAASQASPTSGEPPAPPNPLQPLLKALDPILKSLGIQDGQVAHDPMVSNSSTTFIAHILQNFGLNWDPAAGTLNGHVYDYYSNAAQPIWYLARSLELFEDFLHIGQDPTQVLHALQYVAALALFDWPTHIAELSSTLSQAPALIAAAVGAAAVPAGSVGGLAGLAGLAGLPQSAAIPPPAAIAPVPGAGWAAAAPVISAGSAMSAPVPPPASAAGVVAGPAPPPPPAPAAVTGPGFLPYLVGPPGVGFGSGMGAGAGAAASARKAASAKKKAPESDIAVAATTAQQRARSRRRATRREHGGGFMDMNITVDPGGPSAASDRAAGPLGIAGTATNRVGTHATGLATLTGNGSDSTAAMPLVPGTWTTGKAPGTGR
ncbi:MAG TPA: hypothetical protein VFR27_03845, partial [Mycobacterium sp.]|nr:hypothetical protein [Mycobacterium sp.]